MYKVGHSSAVSRPTLVYNGRRNVSTRSEIRGKTLNQYISEGDEPYKNQMNVQIPALTKKNHNRAHVNVTKHINMEAVSMLTKVTKEFLTTPDGRPDETIKRYRPKKKLPEDFVPFDVENYLAERFLQDVSLDPKIVSSFCKEILQ